MALTSAIYVSLDSGVSGAKERRPALDRLLVDAKRRKFDTILVYRYERFARSAATARQRPMRVR
ncbi:MAG: recombinase family protein [Candidatus Acidiferrum sp.]